MYTKNKLSNNFRVRTPDSEGNLSIPTPTKNSACEDDEINDWRLSPPSHDLHTKRTLPSHKVKQGTTEAMQETTEERKDAIPVRQKTKANDNIQENQGNDEAKLSLSGCGVNSDTDGAMPTPKAAEAAELSPPRQHYEDKPKPPSNASDDDALDADQQIICSLLKVIDAQKKPGCSLEVSFCVSRKSAKVTMGKDGHYEEDQDFIRKSFIKKGSIAKRVSRVMDKMTGNVHVLKEVNKYDFKIEEIKALLHLEQKNTNISPELYAFSLQLDTVRIHMELVDSAVSLKDVIDHKIDDFAAPFIKMVFFMVFSTIQTMHEYGVKHGDLHQENILFQKRSNQNMKCFLIDFGEATLMDDDYQGSEVLAYLGDQFNWCSKCITKEKTESSQQQSEYDPNMLHGILQSIRGSKSLADTQHILGNLRKHIEGIPDKDKIMKAFIAKLFLPPTPLDKVKHVHDNDQIPERSHVCTSDRETPPAPPVAVEISKTMTVISEQNPQASKLEAQGHSPVAEAADLCKPGSLSIEAVANNGGGSMSSTPDSEIPSVPSLADLSMEPAHPTENIIERAEHVLRTGCMPLMLPARRIWGEKQVRINSIVWPPKDWRTLTGEQKLNKWTSAAITLEGGDAAVTTPCIPDLLDKYNMLCLPGTQIPEMESNKGKLRYDFFKVLIEICHSENHTGDQVQLLQMVEAASALRDTTTDYIISLLDCDGVELHLEDN